jgi:protein-ribulosamine 3-kinase
MQRTAWPCSKPNAPVWNNWKAPPRADRDSARIVLEHLDITAGAGAVKGLGSRLAALHRHGAERFGWNRDNTIGASLQPNDWCEDWITFLRHRRLGFQLDWAARNGYRGPLQESATRLLERLPSLFSDYRPQPSLLHGDLWNGNAGVLSNGQPVLFDPAVYFGDRETDLAMSELFGGFPPAFCSEYRDAWPLNPAYPVHKGLYNLYHLLNQLKLFGDGYLRRCNETIGQLLAEIG